MTVRSEVVQNVDETPKEPFWPEGVKQLQVEFGADFNGTCSVRGIDVDSATQKIVFNGILRTTQQQLFLDAVKAGAPAELVNPSNDNAAAPWPKWYLVPLSPLVQGAIGNDELPVARPGPAARVCHPMPRVVTAANTSTLQASVQALIDATGALAASITPEDYAVVISGGDPRD